MGKQQRLRSQSSKHQLAIMVMAPIIPYLNLCINNVGHCLVIMKAALRMAFRVYNTTLVIVGIYNQYKDPLTGGCW